MDMVNKMSVMTLTDNARFNKQDLIATLRRYGLDDEVDNLDEFMAYACKYAGSDSPSLSDVENAAYTRARDIFVG